MLPPQLPVDLLSFLLNLFREHTNIYSPLVDAALSDFMHILWALLINTNHSERTTSRLALPRSTCGYAETMVWPKVEASAAEYDPLTVNIVTTAVDQASPSIADPSWSKESLFGLLSVLAVFLLPCIGLVIRLCIARCRTSKSTRSPGIGMVPVHSCRKSYSPHGEGNYPQLSIRRSWRRKRPRIRNGRRSTIIVVCWHSTADRQVAWNRTLDLHYEASLL